MKDKLLFIISHTMKRRKHKNNSCSENNYEKRQQIDIVIGDCQEPFLVVTIVPLQSLQPRTREKGRVLGRRAQPSVKK